MPERRFKLAAGGLVGVFALGTANVVLGNRAEIHRNLVPVVHAASVSVDLKGITNSK